MLLILKDANLVNTPNSTILYRTFIQVIIEKVILFNVNLNYNA